MVNVQLIPGATKPLPEGKSPKTS